MKRIHAVPLSARRIWLAAIVAFSLGASPSWAAGADANDKAVLDVVHRHIEAQIQSDVPALDGLTVDNYIEISPLGEVDPKAKMLGFYGGEKPPVPVNIALQEPIVRYCGDVAIVIAKLMFTERNSAMRASYVVQKSGGSWKLISAHYTPIHLPKAPA